MFSSLHAWPLKRTLSPLTCLRRDVLGAAPPSLHTSFVHGVSCYRPESCVSLCLCFPVIDMSPNSIFETVASLFALLGMQLSGRPLCLACTRPWLASTPSTAAGGYVFVFFLITAWSSKDPSMFITIFCCRVGEHTSPPTQAAQGPLC